MTSLAGRPCCDLATVVPVHEAYVIALNTVTAQSLHFREKETAKTVTPFVKIFVFAKGQKSLFIQTLTARLKLTRRLRNVA
jgi:hypothetical protein